METCTSETAVGIRLDLHSGLLEVTDHCLWHRDGNLCQTHIGGPALHSLLSLSSASLSLSLAFTLALFQTHTHTHTFTHTYTHLSEERFYKVFHIWQTYFRGSTMTRGQWERKKKKITRKIFNKSKLFQSYC